MHNMEIKTMKEVLDLTIEALVWVSITRCSMKLT